MYKCPVCETESDAVLCRNCGFDITSDYRRHPTLVPLPASTVSIARQQQLWQESQQSRFHCPTCGGSFFIITEPEYGIQCARCAKIHGTAVFWDIDQRSQDWDIQDVKIVSDHFAGKTVTMRSEANGKYLCADALFVSVPLRANRDTASDWETFRISPVGQNSQVTIKNCFGKHLGIKKDLSICAVYPLEAEPFHIYQRGDHYYLKSITHNRWLSVRIDTDQAPVLACADAASTWERIQIEIVDQDLFR